MVFWDEIALVVQVILPNHTYFFIPWSVCRLFFFCYIYTPCLNCLVDFDVV